MLQLYSIQPHVIDVVVPKSKVNIYLSLLWDQLSNEFGSISCTHKYTKSQNPELYIYKVQWAHSHFYARIEFFNHTSRGIKYIHIAAITKKDEIEDLETINKIKAVILETQNQVRKQVPKPYSELSAIVRIPITTKYPLGGLYWLDDNNTAIFPSSMMKINNGLAHKDQLKSAIVSFLEFHLFEPSQTSQFVEARSKGLKIAAALSLLTQNLFLCNFDQIEVFSSEVLRERQLRLENIKLGGFAEDFGLFEEQPTSQIETEEYGRNKEIIEYSDVIHDGKINLPNSVLAALRKILNSDLLCQAANRFQEGLILDREILFDNQSARLGLMIVPYQLIAFVASIEALLDTSPENIETPCPSCGTPIVTQERMIVKKFNNLVEDLLGDNPVIKKMFKDLYQDRSKFVHTGKDLYNPLALVHGRPFLLEGKNCRKPLPDYFFNIQDFTGLLLRRYVYRQIKPHE